MIAAVRLPYFAAALEIQANPALKNTAFVIGEQRVMSLSRQAAQAGLYPGMTVREAQALCRELQVFPPAPLRQERGIERILQTLTTFAPQVEAEDTPLLQADARRRKNAPTAPLPGRIDPQSSLLCYVDFGKLALPESQKLGETLLRSLHQHNGLRGTLGLAGSKFTARVAAYAVGLSEILLVMPKEQAAFLSAFPATLLPADGESLRQLELLGLHTLGQIAALPVHALQERFGKLGRILHRLANGQDTSPVSPYTPPEMERLSHSFELPLSNRQTLEAVLGKMMETLMGRLQTKQQAAREITLLLTFEDKNHAEHSLILRKPTAETTHLQRTAAELLALIPMQARVGELELALGDLQTRPMQQLSLFEREPMPQEHLREVLYDLMARYGEDRFRKVRVIDQHAPLPERRFRWERVREA